MNKDAVKNLGDVYLHLSNAYRKSKNITNILTRIIVTLK